MKKTAPLMGTALGVALLGGIAIAQQYPTSPAQQTPTTPNASSSPSASPSTSASPSASPSTPASPSPSASASVAPTEAVLDNQALNYLHHINQLEIQEANTALGQLSDPSAVALANAMVTDHTQNETQVVSVASQVGDPLLGFQASTYDLATDQALAAVPSAEYDATFKSIELSDHKGVLAQLQLYQTEITNPAILNLIGQTITVVQKHISLAGAAAGASPSASPSGSASPSPSGSTSPSPSPSGSTSPSPSPSMSGMR